MRSEEYREQRKGRLAADRCQVRLQPRFHPSAASISCSLMRTAHCGETLPFKPSAGVLVQPHHLTTVQERTICVANPRLGAARIIELSLSGPGRFKPRFQSVLHFDETTGVTHGTCTSCASRLPRIEHASHHDGLEQANDESLAFYFVLASHLLGITTFAGFDGNILVHRTLHNPP